MGIEMGMGCGDRDGCRVQGDEDGDKQGLGCEGEDGVGMQMGRKMGVGCWNGMGCRDKAGDRDGDGVWGHLGGSTCLAEQWEQCRKGSSEVYPVIKLQHHSWLTQLSWHLWLKSNCSSVLVLVLQDKLGTTVHPR